MGETPVNVGIYLYDQAEVLDFSGPFEVFSTASRICTGEDPFRVFLIGETGDVVHARGGFRVLPDFGFDNHPSMDLLLVVGGDHTEEMDKARVISWLSQQAKTVPVLASVCTGVFLLARAGALKQTPVTTHWEDIPDLRRVFPHLDVVWNVRWTDHDGLLTSGGMSAGIDMSLHLVSKLHSPELAEKTARQMEFVWTKEL